MTTYLPTAKPRGRRRADGPAVTSSRIAARLFRLALVARDADTGGADTGALAAVAVAALLLALAATATAPGAVLIGAAWLVAGVAALATRGEVTR